jgi:hypothetical protein
MKGSKKVNKDTEYVLSHLDQSDKLLKKMIEQVFEFANQDNVTVHVINDKTEDSVVVDVLSLEGKSLYRETFETKDDRPYELKINSSLHIVVGSLMKTLLENLTPKEG